MDLNKQGFEAQYAVFFIHSVQYSFIYKYFLMDDILIMNIFAKFI